MKVKRFTNKKEPTQTDNEWESGSKSEVLLDFRRRSTFGRILAVVAFIFLRFWGMDLHAQGILGNFEKQFNKIQPPSGKCIESALPIIDIGRMNAQLNADTVDYEDGLEAFRQLTRISVNSNQENDSVWNYRDSIMGDYIKQNILPITVLDYHYLVINDTLKNESRILFNDQDSSFEFNLDGYNHGIYQRKSCLATILPMDKVRTDFDRLVLDERLIFGNRDRSKLTNCKLKMGSKVIPIQLNVPVPISWSRDSLQFIQFIWEVSKTDERVKEMSAPYFINLNSAGLVTNVMVNFNTAAQGIIAASDVSMFTKEIALDENRDISAHVTFHYGKDETGGIHPCLSKPIILVEGIDFGYKNYPVGLRDGKCGSMGYMDLLKGKQWNITTQKWENVESLSQAPGVIRQYRNAGYDVVFVDFYDGAADLKLNANLLVKVIKEVQSITCGDELHVVGVSMGGIVSKIALKQMEVQNISSCVTSFTGFDAPNQGANIPLSLQRFISELADVSSDCRDLKTRMLERPAAKQLLVVHETKEVGPDKLRLEYLKWDSAFGGYPSQLHLLAISNGSGLGAEGNLKKVDGSYLSEGETMAAIEFKFNGTFLSRIFSLSLPTMAELQSMDKTMAGNRRIVGYVRYPFKRRFFYSDSKNPKLDHVNGSWTGAIRQLNQFGKIGNRILKTNFTVPFTTFVTAVSSLDLSWSNPIGKGTIYSARYTPDEKSLELPLGKYLKSPFEAVFVPQYNQEHAFIDSTKDGNCMWLLNRLKKLSADNHPQMINYSYNFNHPLSKRVKSIEIKHRAKFELNGRGTYPGLIKSDSLMKVYQYAHNYYSSNCNSSTYMVMDTAEFIVGNPNGTTSFTMLGGSKMWLNNFSSLTLSTGMNKMIIERNAEVHVSENATLTIGNLAQLIVKEGGIVHLEKGAKLYLDGAMSLFHLKGRLIVDSGAVVCPLSKSNRQVGLFKLTRVGYGYGEAEIEAKGKDVKFKFVGNGKYSTVPNLQIEGGVLFPYRKSSISYPISGVEVVHSRVKFGSNAKMICGGNVQIDSSLLESIDWANSQGKGLMYYGNDLNSKGSDFYDLDTAVRIYTQLGVGNPVFDNCRFTQNTVGLCQEGKGILVSNSKFDVNSVAMNLSEMSSEIGIDNCQYLYNKQLGLGIENATLNSKLAFITRSEFNSNKVGINAEKQSILSKCDEFTLNQVGIKSSYSQLIMSKRNSEYSELFHQTVGSGYNSFANNYTTSILLDNAMPLLEGGNNFIASKNFSGSKTQIIGSVKMDYNQLYWDKTKTKILLGDNTWKTSVVKGYNMDSVDLNFVDLVDPSNIPLKLEGGINLKYNYDVCYDASKYVNLDEGLKKGKSGTQDVTGKFPGVSAYEDGIEIEGKDVIFCVYNTAGQLIMKNTTLEEGKNRYQLSAGIYFIQVKGDTGYKTEKVYINN